MNAGFYKFDGTLMYAANWVRAPDYELHVNERMTYSYPINGWYWFDSLYEACLHFDLNIQDYLPKEE